MKCPSRTIRREVHSNTPRMPPLAATRDRLTVESKRRTLPLSAPPTLRLILVSHPSRAALPDPPLPGIDPKPRPRCPTPFTFKALAHSSSPPASLCKSLCARCRPVFRDGLSAHAGPTSSPAAPLLSGTEFPDRCEASENGKSPGHTARNQRRASIRCAMGGSAPRVAVVSVVSGANFQEKELELWS